MNASPLTRNATLQNDQVEQYLRDYCEQIRKQEADRLFEARLQWFLAVSRNA